MLHLFCQFSVKATRSSDDPTVIIVTWTVTDTKVTKLSLEIQKGGEGGDSGWERVPGASDMSTSKTEFKVENLKADEKYLFRMDMRRPGEMIPVYVQSNMGRLFINFQNCSAFIWKGLPSENIVPE